MQVIRLIGVLTYGENMGISVECEEGVVEKVHKYRTTNICLSYE